VLCPHRFKVTCVNLNVNNIEINCIDETKILGTILVSASKFKISLSKNKISFFVNANKLFSKLGCSNAPVFLSLLNSHCLSALLYNLEVMTLVKSEMKKNNMLTCVFHSYIERDYLSICNAWNNMGRVLPLCKKQA